MSCFTQIESDGGRTEVTSGISTMEDDEAEYWTDDEGSETCSVPEAMYEFKYENGRGYPDDTYYGPTDDRAQETMGISDDFYYVESGGRHYNAPVVNPQNILDLGTGTGTWAIHVATMTRGAIVTGVDSSPILLPTMVAPNCQFRVDDYNIDNTHLFGANRYCLVHQRGLNGTVKDWLRFYRICFNALRPGGWIDITELCLLLRVDPKIGLRTFENRQRSNSEIMQSASCGPRGEVHEKVIKAAMCKGRKADREYFAWLDEVSEIYRVWNDAICGAGKRAGMRFDLLDQLEKWLGDTGFVNITLTKKEIPIGSWGDKKAKRKIGFWNVSRLGPALDDYSRRRLTTQMGWSIEKVENYCELLRTLLWSTEIPSYQHMYCITAQKPSAEAAGGY